MRVICALATTAIIFSVASASNPPGGPLLCINIAGASRETGETPDPVEIDTANANAVRPVELKPALNRVLRGPEDLVSTFDANLVSEFQKSWKSVHNGKSTWESVILILRTVNGFQARRLKMTFEHRKATFPWHPGIVAVIHTHPNDCPAKPQPDDIALAERHRIFMFTLTDRGMYVYDPTRRQTSKVMDALHWLDPKGWEKRPPLKS
jgi:hypothetical protein